MTDIMTLQANPLVLWAISLIIVARYIAPIFYRPKTDVNLTDRVSSSSVRPNRRRIKETPPKGILKGGSIKKTSRRTVPLKTPRRLH